MRIGVALLPEMDWPADLSRWKRIEDYGFDHAWTLDHLAWRSLADSPWIATIPTLVAAALNTETVRLGTFVSSPNFRHPVPLSKELITLDVMSGGRITVGLGAGATGFDATVLGKPALTPRQASGRFHEFVTLLDEILRQRITTRHGEWFTAIEARNAPGPPPASAAALRDRSQRSQGDEAGTYPRRRVGDARTSRPRVLRGGLVVRCRTRGRTLRDLRIENGNTIDLVWPIPGHGIPCERHHLARTVPRRCRQGGRARLH